MALSVFRLFGERAAYDAIRGQLMNALHSQIPEFDDCRPGAPICEVDVCTKHCDMFLGVRIGKEAARGVVAGGKGAAGEGAGLAVPDGMSSSGDARTDDSSVDLEAPQESAQSTVEDTPSSPDSRTRLPSLLLLSPPASRPEHPDGDGLPLPPPLTIPRTRSLSKAPSSLASSVGQAMSAGDPQDAAVRDADDALLVDSSGNGGAAAPLEDTSGPAAQPAALDTEEVHLGKRRADCISDRGDGPLSSNTNGGSTACWTSSTPKDLGEAPMSFLEGKEYLDILRAAGTEPVESLRNLRSPLVPSEPSKTIGPGVTRTASASEATAATAATAASGASGASGAAGVGAGPACFGRTPSQGENEWCHSLPSLDVPGRGVLPCSGRARRVAANGEASGVAGADIPRPLALQRRDRRGSSSLGYPSRPRQAQGERVHLARIGQGPDGPTDPGPRTSAARAPSVEQRKSPVGSRAMWTTTPGTGQLPSLGASAAPIGLLASGQHHAPEGFRAASATEADDGDTDEYTRPRPQGCGGSSPAWVAAIPPGNREASAPHARAGNGGARAAGSVDAAAPALPPRADGVGQAARVSTRGGMRAPGAPSLEQGGLWDPSRPGRSVPVTRGAVGALHADQEKHVELDYVSDLSMLLDVDDDIQDTLWMQAPSNLD